MAKPAPNQIWLEIKKLIVIIMLITAKKIQATIIGIAILPLLYNTVSDDSSPMQWVSHIDFFPRFPVVLIGDDAGNIIHIVANFATKMVFHFVVYQGSSRASHIKSAMEDICEPEAVTASKTFDNLFPIATVIKFFDEVQDGILIHLLLPLSL
jgi:hypothetical protein